MANCDPVTNPNSLFCFCHFNAMAKECQRP
jgi:hypothetical protein